MRAITEYDMKKDESFVRREQAVKAIEVFCDRKNPGFIHKVLYPESLQAAIYIRIRKSRDPIV